jgi:hypothetical protein
MWTSLHGAIQSVLIREVLLMRGSTVYIINNTDYYRSDCGAKEWEEW